MRRSLSDGSNILHVCVLLERVGRPECATLGELKCRDNGLNTERMSTLCHQGCDNELPDPWKPFITETKVKLTVSVSEDTGDFENVYFPTFENQYVPIKSARLERDSIRNLRGRHQIKSLIL